MLLASDDLRRIADSLDALNQILIKEDICLTDSLVSPPNGVHIELGEMPILLDGFLVGAAVVDDGWIGFQQNV